MPSIGSIASCAVGRRRNNGKALTGKLESFAWDRDLEQAKPYQIRQWLQLVERHNLVIGDAE